MSRKSLLLSRCLVAALDAQTGSSTIIGTLTDPADAVIPNATLTLTERATGESRSTTSTKRACYACSIFAPATTRGAFMPAGSRQWRSKTLSLSSAENRDMGRMVMQVGEVSEEISVTATVTPVQTASSERSALIDQTQLTQVALKGRDAFGYMRLIPGGWIQIPARDLAGPGSASNLSINGMASNTKNVTFDGVNPARPGRRECRLQVRGFSAP
jgi:hypothetical protein